MLPNGAYNHKEHEAEVLKRWLESGAYKPRLDRESETQDASTGSGQAIASLQSTNWTLICPPPNAYGRPHVGNISGYAYIDAMARIQRMKGKNVLVVPGKDHAGLEGEGVFVREVLEKQGRKKFDMKREDFYEEMMEFFKNNMQKARKDEKEIGLSADFDLDTFTLDPDIVDTVLDTFIEMYQKGMIYKGVRIVNWDPKARTAVADNQVIYEDAVTPFYYFKYSLTEIDETKRRIWRLNFYKDGIFNAIKSGKKTVETRALNPEEPERYFGEIKVGDVIICVNKNSGEEMTVVVQKVRLYSDAQVFFQGEDFTKIRPDGGQYTSVEELINSYNSLAEGYGNKLNNNGAIAIEMAEFSGDPDPKALELKHQFEGKQIEWDFERNRTRDGKEDLPFTFGMLDVEAHSVETQNIASLQQDKVEIVGLGYNDSSITSPTSPQGETQIANIEQGNNRIKSGDKLKGKVVGILMRMNAPHRLVVVNNSDETVGKEYILSLQNEIQKIFEFESKHCAGSHIILFDEYPEDKFYTNGFIIGTVRPETVFADTAIACSPDDERYKDFIGKSVEVEFLGEKKKLNFISDYSVLKEFGTGLLKVTPAHANEDWEIAQRHPKECLPAIQVIGYDLKMNSLAGKYADMKIKEARVAMEEDMIKHGNLIHVDREYKNKVAIAERTKAPIEPLLSSQWYLSYDKPINSEGMTLRQAALEMVNGKEFTAETQSVETQDPSTSSGQVIASLQQNTLPSSGEIKIYPPSMVGKFNNWMNNLRDWAISRSLWWGYRLPVWYHGEVKEEIGTDGQVRELLKLSGNITKPDVQIVTAKVEDAEAIHKISVDGWHDNFVNDEVGFTIEKMKDKFGKEYDNPEVIGNIKELILSDHTKYFVAKSQNQIIGWVSVDHINQEDTNWLDIYIARDFRGKGVGEMLLKHAVRSLGTVERFDIAVPEKSPAVNFYKKLGFVEYDRNDKNQYGFPVIQMKLYSSDFNTKQTILVDAVRTIISANENYDLESFSLNKELADYLTKLNARVIVVTNATNDGILERINELLQDYNFEIFSLHKKPLKTESEYFLTLSKDLSINLSESIYFDHSQDNIDSAIKAGVRNTKLYSQDNIEIINWLANVTKLEVNSAVWTALEYNNPNHIKVQKESPGEGWYQDESVLDTWFSSAQWPYATLMKYGLLQERYPTDVMVSGFDILENWDSRMMMFSYFKTGQIPFKNLYLTGLVKGTDGQKMSKSKGNIIDIDQVREKYGTDSVRMVYYYQNTAGADYAMTYEKLETFKRFANKIWNASKFVLMNIDDQTDTNVNNLQLEDLKLKENIDLFNFITQAKEHVTKNIDEYEFGLATYNLYQYFWHDFADIHIEAVKKFVLSQRDKTTNEVIQEPNAEEKAETTRVLLFTLKNFMKMLHPFMPFITQRIWEEIAKEEDEDVFLMYCGW